MNAPRRSKAPPKLLDREALLHYAAQALSARAQSSSELRARLKRKAERAEDVEEVLSKMKELGFLSDQKFADAYASWRRDNQGFGKTRVLRDLMSRRVAPALAKEAVDQAFAETDESVMIADFLMRKYRGRDLGVLLKEEKHLASAFRKLRGAGFSAGNSIRVLKRYAAQADQLEDMDEPEES